MSVRDILTKISLALLTYCHNGFKQRPIAVIDNAKQLSGIDHERGIKKMFLPRRTYQCLGLIPKKKRLSYVCELGHTLSSTINNGYGNPGDAIRENMEKKTLSITSGWKKCNGHSNQNPLVLLTHCHRGIKQRTIVIEDVLKHVLCMYWAGNRYDVFPFDILLVIF